MDDLPKSEISSWLHTVISSRQDDEYVDCYTSTPAQDRSRITRRDANTFIQRPSQVDATPGVRWSWSSVVPDVTESAITRVVSASTSTSINPQPAKPPSSRLQIGTQSELLSHDQQFQQKENLWKEFKQLPKNADSSYVIALTCCVLMHWYLDIPVLTGICPICYLRLSSKLAFVSHVLNHLEASRPWYVQSNSRSLTTIPHLLTPMMPLPFGGLTIQQKPSTAANTAPPPSYG